MMEKRDLKEDLRLCKQLEDRWAKVGNRPWLTEELFIDFAHAAREGWPHAIERALKAEALARELAEVLLLYEKWEADLLMDNSLWQSASGLPFITQEVWDDLVAVQVERNKVLHKAKEVLGDDRTELAMS